MLAALLLTTTLSACATSASAPLDRSLPTACDQLAVDVKLPEVKKGDDARAQLAKHRALLILTNRRLDAARRCYVLVRKEYAR